MRASSWIVCGLGLLVTPCAWSIDPPVGRVDPVLAPTTLEPPEIQQVANITPAQPAAAAGDLAFVLAQWTAAGNAIQTLEGKFVRQEFDSEHTTETRGYGKLCYEAEGRAMYALEPYPLQSNSRSSRATPRGVPYTLQASKAETLYWISGQLARINTVAREYELFEVPEPFWSTGVVEATESFDVLWTALGCLERYLPGLVETDVAELQQRFDWTLVTYDQDQIVLQGKPLTPAEQRHYSVVHVYLHAKTYLTKGTKTVDTTGTREVVHAFSELKVNAAKAANAPDWAPPIGQMRLLTPPPLAPPAEDAP